jgi:undecaprenyl-diphosphatase
MLGMKTRFLAIALPMTILLSVGAAVQDYFVGDIFLARAIQEIEIAPFRETMEFTSLIGRGLVMAAIALACFTWFLWKRQKAEYLVFGAGLLSFGLNLLLKELVARPRPTEDLVVVWQSHSGLSFPSGHAFTAVVLFGLLYYLAPVLFPWRRAITLERISCLSLITLIGLSRVYLGVHWPSDILGGFLVGGIVLALLIHLHRLLSPQVEVPRASRT